MLAERVVNLSKECPDEGLIAGQIVIITLIAET